MSPVDGIVTASCHDHATHHDVSCCESTARLENKEARLAKQGGDFSCWDPRSV